mgnify:CR=1 FL=1
MGLKRTEEAAACFCKVIHAQARSTAKHEAAGACTLHAGRDRRGREHLQEWLEGQPRIRLRCTCWRHALVEDVPKRASNGFVERTFDSFASSFEAKLQRLSYRAPALVAAMLGETARLEPLKRLDVLDAGCGTGLCGPLVAPYARRLDRR